MLKCLLRPARQRFQQPADESWLRKSDGSGLTDNPASNSSIAESGKPLDAAQHRLLIKHAHGNLPIFTDHRN
jgi:hypothetical protein